jgi:methionyl-tRNA synthetase
MIEQFGFDAFRYFLLREVPFGHDGDFSRQALMGRINSDLANGLGNLLSRTVTLIERFSNGKVPEPATACAGELEESLQRTAIALPSHLAEHLKPSNLEFNRALESIWSLVQLVDQYIDKTAPWTLAKRSEDRPRLNTVLYHAAEAIRFLGIAVFPFVPQTADQMKRQLGLMLNFSKPLLSDEIRWGGLLPGTEVAKGTPLFPRIEVAVGPDAKGARSVSSELPRPADQTTGTNAAGAMAPEDQISLAEFQKIHLKVAKILSAERVPKSEKLIKLQVDLGTEQRQIVAGIGKSYEPEALIGRRVVVVANLKPAKLMGVESQGMVLAAGEKDVLGLVTILEDAEPGTKVK